MSSLRNRFLRVILGLTSPKMAKLPLRELRNAFAAECAKYTRPAKGTTHEQVALPHCSAEWVSVRGLERPRVVLYFHGGGYVMGSAATHRNMVSRLAQFADAQVLLVDYRLAPEHPFPAPVEDAIDAYEWLLKSGFEPEKIVLAGDSSGAALVLTTMMHNRERGLPQPAAGVLISPWMDLTHGGESIEGNKSSDPMVKVETLLSWAALYSNGHDLRDPLLSPLYGNMAGMPPLHIAVSSSEILYSDALRIAEKGRAAGVETELEAVADMVHVWPLFNDLVPEGRRTLEEMGRFIAERTGVSRLPQPAPAPALRTRKRAS